MTSIKDELTINGMRLRNRLALPPLTTNYASREGTVTKEVMQFYEERSKDVGLVIVEATAARADGRIVPGSLGLWEDSQIDGMLELTRSIKELGAATIVQINHAGARCIPLGGELQGASPSGFAFRPDIDPITLTSDQIELLINGFANAAHRAIKAGFDGIEIHGAHFYLISQFLSPLTNQRTDKYGGDASARATFAIEVTRAVREKIGKNHPIFFRLNALEKVEGGQPLDDALTISCLLAEEGIDALDVSLIAQSSWREVEDKKFLLGSSALEKKDPFGANVEFTKELKEATGLPVIAVGKLGDEIVAADAVQKSQIDILAIGRQMIADPDSAGKILSGKGNEIVPCKECMNCFLTIGQGAPMGCTVNKNLPFSKKNGKP